MRLPTIKELAAVLTARREEREERAILSRLRTSPIERSWQLAFQFQPTDSATCDEFTVQSAFQKLVALVRGARVDDAAIKAKTGGKSALLAHVLLTPTRSFIAIIIFKHAVREERG